MSRYPSRDFKKPGFSLMAVAAPTVLMLPMSPARNVSLALMAPAMGPGESLATSWFIMVALLATAPRNSSERLFKTPLMNGETLLTMLAIADGSRYPISWEVKSVVVAMVAAIPAGLILEMNVVRNAWLLAMAAIRLGLMFMATS